MSFRDERDASAARIETLEREIADAKARLGRAERAAPAPAIVRAGNVRELRGYAAVALVALAVVFAVMIDARRRDTIALTRCERALRSASIEAPRGDDADAPTWPRPLPPPDAPLVQLTGHAVVTGADANEPVGGTPCTIVLEQEPRRACRVFVHCEDATTPDGSVLAVCATTADAHGDPHVASIVGDGVAYDAGTGRFTWSVDATRWTAEVDAFRHEDP